MFFSHSGMNKIRNKLQEENWKMHKYEEIKQHDTKQPIG